MLNFLTESVRNGEGLMQETKTIGGFGQNNDLNSFDNIFESTIDGLAKFNVEGMQDIATILKNPAALEKMKTRLLEPLQESCDAIKNEFGVETNYTNLYEATGLYFDNVAADLYNESVNVGQLLPIKSVDLPILIKNNLTLATKDIIQSEVTASPVIKKHIERRWIVDKKTDKKYEYPQCFFKNEYQEIFNAGKGLPIKNDPVDITSGLFNYNIAEKLTNSVNPADEKLPINVQIISANVLTDPADPASGVDVPLQMRIEMSTGAWVGGEIKITDPVTGVVETVDYITGHADFTSKLISLSSSNGRVQSVVFAGYLSNEDNLRALRIERTREEKEWKVEDGFRMEMPYSLEELNDAKALLNMDLYKLTYNDISDILVQVEDSGILKFLDNEYAKYKGVQLDTLGFNPFIREHTFDGDYAAQTTALPSEYIETMLKYTIDRFIMDVVDTAKFEDMTFVLYGNPRYISLFDSKVNWVVKAGSSIGGVKANYSYGIMSVGNIKIQVVSTMKYDANDDRKLRIIPYPTSKDQYTFKYYKYTTHIMTSQNSAYRAADLAGGSATYIMGTTRNVMTSIQGIQGGIKMTNLAYDPILIP